LDGLHHQSNAAVPDAADKVLRKEVDEKDSQRRLVRKDETVELAFAPSSSPVEKFLTDLWSIVRVELPANAQGQDGGGGGSGLLRCPR
jgi:hypothetical protein